MPTLLSSRLQQLKGSATLAVDARVKQLRAEGVNVIGFGAGEPDFGTPQHITQAAIDALQAGKTHYAPVPGDPKAREAIAEKLRNENNIHCAMGDVLITVGAKHALYLAAQCLIDEALGHQVIVPTPAWVSYRPIIELAGGEVIEVPATTANDFKITPQQLDEAITPRTVAMILNTPSNPCGTMYTPEELHGLADVLAAHPHVTLISDEIYEKLIYGGIQHCSPASIASIADRVVTINGLSKAFAMTGWRIGYMCAPGRGGEVVKAAMRLQSQMTSCITSFVYPAIVEALTNGGPSVEQMRQTFATRAELMYSRVAAMPGVRCPRPTGAFYVFPDISATFGKTSPQGRRIETALSFAGALLDEAHVAVVPGEDFGVCAASHVRLSFACSEADITAGCDAIDAWIRSLS